MADFLEFSDVCAEQKGAMTAGKLKLTDQQIIFKNSKTGKVDQLAAGDIEIVNWQRLAGEYGIRIFLKNGTLHRFGGFKDADQDRIAKFFTTNYKKDVLEKELSVKGWNWGTAKFHGTLLNFEVSNHTAFEIPLSDVSQCTTGKNEVTLEFHQNDDAPVGLMEMRFFIPSSELAGDVDPVEAFQKQVVQKASVISATGDAIAIFREIQCLTPRGRYDIKIFQSFFQLHGKTFDYKIPMSTVLRLFLLPHKDSRQMFFVVSLDPPIRQGQTRYHFLVLLFNQEDETSIELPFTEEELKEKYDGKLTKELSGEVYNVLGRVMKVMVNTKITVPGGFVGHSATPAISCSYKAAAGYIYPLQRGFIYIHKPPIHIRFEEIATVNFARGGGSTRSFDFEIETKSGVVHTFSSIEKEEYGKLFDFISEKKLRVKNRSKMDKPTYQDEFGNSDAEDEPDAYLARVKAEAEERDDEEGGGDSEDESEDEDFKPTEDVSDVAEEYDSNASSSSESGSEEGGGGGGGSGGEAKKKEKKEKKRDKPKKAKTVSEKPRKARKKKVKDENAPKRPASAFMLWLNETREKIKADNPGIAITELSKKAGEMWREMTDEKKEWEAKAAKLKEEYDVAMKEYKESDAYAAAAERIKKEKDEIAESKPKKEKKEKKKSQTPAKPSPTKAGSGTAAYKSKEYISSEGSSSSSDEDDKPLKKLKTNAKKESKAKEKKASGGEEEKASGGEEEKASGGEEEEEEEILSTPPSSGEDSD